MIEHITLCKGLSTNETVMDIIKIVSYQRIVGNHGTEVAERGGETVGMC
jgi:hypothetical protein